MSYSPDPGAIEELAPKKLHLNDCGTRLVMSSEKNTAYLVPSNTDYFYEIGCIAKGDGCSLQTTKKFCSQEEFPINWIGSDYLPGAVSTVARKLERPSCYWSDMLWPQIHPLI